MDDARRVHRHERFGEPVRQCRQRGFGERPELGHRVRQRDPGDITGGQPRRPRIDIGVEYRRGEGATDALSRGDLTTEPRTELLVDQIRADHLHGDGAPARIPAQIHLAHAPGTQNSQQSVVADPPRIVRVERLHRGWFLRIR